MGGFAVVIYIVCGVGILAAIVTVAGSGKAWQEYQERGMVMERGRAEAPVAPASSPEATAEIRQMLEASNARRVRRGEAPLDIETELRRLLREGSGPAAAARDPDVVAEVRVLVEKRNQRRIRAGEAPLDVEAEVAARLAALGD